MQCGIPTLEWERQNITQVPMLSTEHRQIEDIFHKMSTELGKSNIATDELEKDLIRVLSSHNRKEEIVLYHWINGILTQNEIIAILKEITLQ